MARAKPNPDQGSLFAPEPEPERATVTSADWPYGRVYTPREVAQWLPTPQPAPRFRACTQCEGYLQGTREATGECLNCVEGRGWETQPVLGEKERAAWMAKRNARRGRG